MKMVSEINDIVEAYNSSLQELTANSKPHITNLTILAGEYIEYAHAIVQAVERHLQEVRSEIKLPVLYLIDSIIKNLTAKDNRYRQLFSKNIVSTFCHVFEKVDENTRLKMWKLRQTWKEIFSEKKLYELDAKINQKIDPAWPVNQNIHDGSRSSQNASKIHINPKFFSVQQQKGQQTLADSPKLVEATIAEQKMREELIQKQKELVELQKKKLELEMTVQQNKFTEKLEPLIKSELQKHIKVGTIQNTETIVVPVDTIMPNKFEKQKITPPKEKSSIFAEKKRNSPRLLPADPRLKTAAALQNGDKSSSNNSTREDHQATKSLTIVDKSRSRTTSESSLFNVSPIRPREAPAPVPCFEIGHSDKNNADLSLKTNIENKRIDNDSTQRCNNRKNKTSNKKTVKSGEEQESKISSPSKSSSTTRSSSSSSSSKSKEPSSSFSSSSSTRKSKSRSSKNASSSSSSSSSSPRKKSSSSSSSSKSRKRSRSPHHHHHHHHSSPKATFSEPHLGLSEEEQLGGSIVVSPPQPVLTAAPSGKDGKENQHRKDNSSTGTRKERKHNRDNAKSPEKASRSQDEDLRPALLVATTPSAGITAAAPTGAVTSSALVTKEDLDLRVLPPPIPLNKRKSTDQHQSSNAKKSKEEKFDELFGKEDVDLRQFAPVPKTPLKPSNSSPTGNSSEKGSWAKVKKSEKSSETSRPSLDTRSNRDQRPNRPKPYNRPNALENDSRDRRRTGGRDLERNSDGNAEFIMKQAAEQLNQGTITKIEYNKIIQGVLHMSEDQKLKAAQRKERESKGNWDRTDKGVRPKDHGMHPRPPGPRWGQPWHQQPWAHPPGPPFQGPHFRPEFRPPMGPWQNHPRMPFGGPMRPDFHHQFHGGFNPRLPPPGMGPNGPLIMPNGPPNSMAAGGLINPIGNLMGNATPPTSGSGSAMGSQKRPRDTAAPSNATESNSSWISSNNSDSNNASLAEETAAEPEEAVINANSDELPAVDTDLLEKIKKDTMLSISIDGVPREIRYYEQTAVVFIGWDDPRDIGFQNGTRRVLLGQLEIICSFNEDYQEFSYEGEIHKIKLGAPTRELWIDDKWYQCYFGGQPIMVELGNKRVSVELEGPPPSVKIGTKKRTDLVLGKINLIINAIHMFPVFVDAKPQMFEIEEGKPVTLEFIDSLRTVLFNGRPFNVEFGEMPKPIKYLGKKHFIRFSVLPQSFRAGYVKISGMRGEQPKELSPKQKSESTADESSIGQELTNSTAAARSPIETDSTSQDDLYIKNEQGYLKADLQLDVLSSVIPSAMAPSSGMSYQAETVETAPAATPAVPLQLSLDQLLQRLIESGLVPGAVSNPSETKKTEEEEEKKAPEVDPATFDKPETLKLKPVIVSTLFTGIQCSSCGLRFAPELATKYSRHLDWHFRQNRNKKDSSKKVNSRNWYYAINDWIQYEECEDVDDRGQNWFETEKQQNETEVAVSEEPYDEAAQPSVPTGSDEDAYCLVCREAFSQFYNDEKDEWHLRPAVSFADKNFHPLCLEDHKRALEESATSVDTNNDELNTSVKNEVDEDIKDEIAEDKDEAIKEEKMEVDDEQEVGEQTESMDLSESAIKEEQEIKDEIVETKSEEISCEDTSKQPIEETESEEIEKSKEFSQETVEASANENEIENKPEELATIDEEVADEEESAEVDTEDSQTDVATVDSTQVEVKSSIDGNVELEAPSTIPAAQSRIKINITKPLNSPKEPKEEKEPEPEEKSDEEEEEVILQPVSIKPALQDRNLKALPPVERGCELSGLCSVM